MGRWQRQRSCIAVTARSANTKKSAVFIKTAIEESGAFLAVPAIVSTLYQIAAGLSDQRVSRYLPDSSVEGRRSFVAAGTRQFIGRHITSSRTITAIRAERTAFPANRTPSAIRDGG
ncbi:hypothetical protein [Sphingobium sp. EM0848]|uniref:hypothetical protein n=1 Tax=Sphingobium sp. EM0848 TaxID=2743473 RepID=UPI00159C97B2|nr:hypothetical protein [Sphingobium sp. EM0848]